MIDIDLSMRVPRGYTERVRPVLRPYVFSICARGDRRKIEPIGSCVLISYRRRGFLVTAGHVWLDIQNSYSKTPLVFNQVGPDASGTGIRFIEVPGNALLSSKVGDKDDNIDLAVIPLDEHFISINEFAAVPERMLATSRNKDDLHRFIHGFASRDNKKYISGGLAQHSPRSLFFLRKSRRNFHGLAIQCIRKTITLLRPISLLGQH